MLQAGYLTRNQPHGASISSYTAIQPPSTL